MLLPKKPCSFSARLELCEKVYRMFHLSEDRNPFWNQLAFFAKQRTIFRQKYITHSFILVGASSMS